MTTSCRPWWRNCALNADSEIEAIDAMEDALCPLGNDVSNVRKLISSLELCHHKADRWVANIIEAIGAEETTKGLGTRPLGQLHPREVVWQNAYDALSAWSAGCPSTDIDLSIDTVPASELLACLGKRSPLKQWQVERVVEKIREQIHFPQSLNDPNLQYQWILLEAGDYATGYRSECPDRYKQNEDFWLTTVRTIIHETESGDEAELSLAIAIDMLMPCNWRFVQNLRVVLAAIGGTLNPGQPFAACARNLSLSPIRARMEVVCDTLRIFCDDAEAGCDTQRDWLSILGEPTAAKKWLAASLEKTISLQLNPPAELHAMSVLAGPEWIKR